MVSDAPPFWWTKADWRAWSLYPVSCLYGSIAGRRMARARPPQVAVPVLCVGNFTVGGAGKTPTAIAIARAAKAKGLRPGFLSRGYGGSLDQTVLVDPHHHRADAVGDEPLLLAREAITVISRRRFQGAERLVAEGADFIIMDDGFQSARLAIDFALVVIDSDRGIGNGHVVPGGPVRAPLRQQMLQMSSLLKVGRGNAADPLVRQAARAGKPVGVATLLPRPMPELQASRLFAFAGIADPTKFYRTVQSLGGEIVATRDFPDHHYFTEDEMADLMADAEAQQLTLVTTAKDAARLRGHHGAAASLLSNTKIVEVDMVFDDPQAPGKMIDETIQRARARRLQAKQAR
ncbi:tetraacyldisaccharide 4'-kinase [Rhizobium sp. SSA_523]|uniref:tetraacyldisaccharide 4'-kinase n=1 Tax=Rhizobium sp. SSA_523 TaxID=2952477 RepID=UPI002090C0A7|nr:tetraacyldisaccharide 4'-kinase [Rhizobium sp. SSA_523]MCO5731138.1 tetraacyldisaccharide 4'-kinase [Rhizobium sp. SSA_523]WKC24068.1 tetraacyldisaccharide 4'-kinase [Rhizobium sp. SSA_523]